MSETRRHAAPRSTRPAGHGSHRATRLPWTPKEPRTSRVERPEPVAELGALEFGLDDGAIHLLDVFRLDVGRHSRPPGPDDVVAPAPRATEPAEAPHLGPGIPQQAGSTASSGRHARRA